MQELIGTPKKRPLELRRGQELSFETIHEYCESAGWPVSLYLPAWVYAKVTLTGVNVEIIKEDEIGSYFPYGPTRIRPKLPENRPLTAEVVEIDSAIILPDKAINPNRN